MSNTSIKSNKYQICIYIKNIYKFNQERNGIKYRNTWAVYSIDQWLLTKKYNEREGKN